MEPKDFFRIIVRRKRTVITAILIVLATAMTGSMRKTPTYGTDCRVLIQAVGTDPTSDKGGSIETFSSLQTLKAVIESPLMAERAANALKQPIERVAGRVNAEMLPQTAIYELKTVDTDAALASAICNAYATEFIELRREEARKFVEVTKKSLIEETVRLTRRADVLAREIDAKGGKGQETTLQLEVERATVLSDMSDRQQRLNRISIQEQLIDQGGGKVLKPAPPTAGRIGPNHKRDGIVALLVGLIFGAALAFVREYLDDTLRDKDAAQRELGIPVLGSMPVEGPADGFVDPSSKAVEAARSLRANLASLGFPHDARALVITSTLSKRRSNTVVNLSAAVAESGRTVLVIGADFRNARLHEQFGVGNGIGLTSVIRGQMSLDQAVRPVPGLDGVYLLPSGPHVANPGELLSSEGMADLLADARDWADAVIIDAPPVLTAADASVLGTLADGVVLVMSAGQTQRVQAIEAKDQLVAAGAHVLGAVLAGTSEHQGGKVLSLGPFRRDDDDEDDLPPLMPYGAWSGADFGGPAATLYDVAQTPLRRANGRNGHGRNGNGSKAVARNGNGNGKTHGRNGHGRTGNGSKAVARNGNGNGSKAVARNGNGNGSKAVARNGNGNGKTHGRNGNGSKAVARNGSGNGKSPGRNGNGSRIVARNGRTTKTGRNGNGSRVVAARRPQRPRA